MPKKLKPEDRPSEEIQVENAELEKQAEDLKQKLDSMPAQPKPGRFDGSTPLPSDERKASEATEAEIERAQVIRDPWAGESALEIKEHPIGRRLNWINPEARRRRGMKGWNPVRYDDPIGRELHLYINDPPSRMVGSAEQDNYVRRGDVMLCWIDVGIWEARQRARVEKAQGRLETVAGHSQTRIGEHGETFGDGLRDDENPRETTAPGFVSPEKIEQDYRRRAQGTVADPRITSPGRRMFDQ